MPLLFLGDQGGQFLSLALGLGLRNCIVLPGGEDDQSEGGHDGQ